MNKIQIPRTSTRFLIWRPYV